MTQTVKVALFSVDPPGLTTFSTFDPESFSVISAINDALIYIDSEGAVQPALATSWRRVSPREMDFELRRGVTFHNGDAFDADDVVATFDAHRLPTPSATMRGILSVVTHATRVDQFTVRIHTAMPDAMLLRRLFISTIYPRRVLEQQGRDALAKQPIGSGPFRFVSYEKGREIVLERNPDHWARKATVDRLRLPILRQKEWVDRLARGEIDIALGLDSHDRVRAGRIPGLQAASRQAAVTQWFLLANRGPLADVRVRRALNHAINRRLLVDVVEHSHGAPQRSIATPGQQGYVECEPYRYSPELARGLLSEAGCSTGIQLRGLVSESSTAVYFTVKEFLSRVGVQLDAEIVPRAEWMRRIVGGHLENKPYAGDFAVAMIDNPILHCLFHHYIFLFSHGPFALLNDPDYDRRFKETAVTFEEESAREAQAQLERYARDQALVLFTVNEDVHAAWREGFSCTLPRSGHFQVDALMSLRVEPKVEPSRTLPPRSTHHPDAGALLEATSHAGAFFLRPGTSFEEPVLQRIWDNIHASEERWRLQNEPMLRELVSQAEIKANLANVLGSTERVALIGYSAENRRLFVNSGYRLMFGDSEVFEHLGSQWPAMRAQVEENGAWLGPIHLGADAQPRAAPDRLYLSITKATDEEGVAMGYTFVFSDFSGEEERIRNQAIRTILDNVRQGLFMCDARGVVLDGYSEACKGFFMDAVSGIEGREISSLLGMDARARDHFMAGYEQIFDDIMPQEVSLGNLPERIAVGPRTFSLAGSVVRAEAGSVSAVLFTLVDISALIEAERELQSLHSVVQVARYRARFEQFATQLHARLCELTQAQPRDPGTQISARLLLHTAKGVFAQFGLAKLAYEIHTIEDHERIEIRDLQAVDDSLRALIERNESIWGIQLERTAESQSTGDSALREIEARVAQARSLDEAKRIVQAGFEGLRQKTVRQLVGPLEESCAQHASRRDKRVDFELHGGELRWPTRLDNIFEVLPQLIRNSIDHGIEPGEERAGKPEVATIRVSVSADAERLTLSISDDGRGIALERVEQRALELGAVNATQLAAMSVAERLQLVFVEGLSTAEQVSETSGRGVGMSAVKHAVAALGGALTLHSTKGVGTELRIGFDVARAQ